MVSGGRFRGGSLALNSVPSRAVQAARGGGTSAEDVLDTYERAEWAQAQSQAIVGGLQQESIVPYWLEPIGESGLYVTPNQPVDPWECDRWSNSPWCGGSGVDPLDLVQLQPAAATPIFSANRDLTEFCVDLGLNLFGLSLPSYSACYRTPSARPLTRIPPPMGIPDAEWHPFEFAGDLPGGLECDYLVEWLHPLSRVPSSSSQSGDLDRYEGLNGYVDESVKGVPIGWYASRPLRQLDELDIPYHPPGTPLFYRLAIVVSQTTPRYSGNPGNLLYSGFLQSVLTANRPFRADHRPTGRIELVSCPIANPTPYHPPPTYSLPPNLPSEPMSCCNTAEIEEMLRVIMLRLGTQAYPMTLPKNLADDSEQTENPTNLTELVVWTVKQLDALMGQFPLEMEVVDVDPTQSGNQTRKIKLPNMAEYAAEMYGLALRSAVNSDIHTNFLMRLAAETVAIKNVGVITQDYARANASYLGYKANTVKRTIDYAFDVTKLDNLEGLLNSSQKSVIGWQDEDENTVQAYLEKLMFAAGIIKQVYFKPNSQVDDLSKQLARLLGTDAAENAAERTKNDEEWRTFLQELNSATGGFNRNSPIVPRVSDPTVSAEADPDINVTGFDLISDVSNPDTTTG